MRIHGDKMEDTIVVEKILRSLTTQFNFVACAIEEAHDIEELSLDELQSSLLVQEKKINQQETEEQALKVSTENCPTSKGERGRAEVEEAMIVAANKNVATNKNINNTMRINSKEEEEEEGATIQQLTETSQMLDATDVTDMVIISQNVGLI